MILTDYLQIVLCASFFDTQHWLWKPDEAVVRAMEVSSHKWDPSPLQVVLSEPVQWPGMHESIPSRCAHIPFFILVHCQFSSMVRRILNASYQWLYILTDWAVSLWRRKCGPSVSAALQVERRPYCSVAPLLVLGVNAGQRHVMCLWDLW
jgi:hypothetical protein